MTDISEHLPGRPSWIDLGTPDLPGAATFYSSLFGWNVLDLGPDAGDYRMCDLDGRPVAGMGPQQNPGPPYWTTYFCVDSADNTVAKITNAGGTVMVPPMDVMEFGRMAVAMDPTGAVFSLWQPMTHKGIGVHSVVGTHCWSELATRDTAAASAFYAAVFGWEVEHITEMHYTIFKQGDDQVAGMMAIDENFPADMPPYWAVYFFTDDIDGTVGSAGSLGASVMMPPTPIEGIGRFAVLADPQGAVFSLLEPNS